MKKFTIFLILILLAAALVWWRHEESVSAGHTGPLSPPPELVPFRTPGGTLHTNGFHKTETLHKQTGSWRGTTSSEIRLNATYRYDIELRSKDWNILIDEGRRVTFIIAPPFKPQLPVAVDSKIVYEWTEEFVADWLLKQRGWPENSERFVKVYFGGEPDIPFPAKKSLKDLLP